MASKSFIEISERPTRLERTFEILPGLTTWLFIIGTLYFSFFLPTIAAYLIIGFDLLWLAKSFGMSRRMVQGYSRLHRYVKYDWNKWLDYLEEPEESLNNLAQTKMSRSQAWMMRILGRYADSFDQIIKPSLIINAVVIATYNEGLDTLEPTVKAVLASNYNPKQIVIVFAYEERDGAQSEPAVVELVKRYGSKFGHMMAVKHPEGMPGEVIGKGGNITFAGRELNRWIDKSKIESENVIVTTLDADNRPHKSYLAYLTFVYCLLPDRKYKSFQPIQMFYNNIWDAPAPMRLIAVGNSFWMIIQSMRPHLLRNFSSHAQSLAALRDTDFWSVKTIVEDGHQYWRTYFRYDGRHDAIPLYVPVYTDAVLSDTYVKTFRAQFIQLRRWAWGVTDIAYVAQRSFGNKKIPLWDKLPKFLRLYEGHFSWATAPLILAFAGWLPLFLSPSSDQNIIAHQLPIIASRIQTVATLGIVLSILLTLISLPPKPAHHKRVRFLAIIFQWVLVPVTGIFFGSAAALNAQTRLMFGRYLEKFDFTEKAVHKALRSKQP